MPRCPSCNAEISQVGRFCSACGATLPSADDTPTIAQEAIRADSITLTQGLAATSDQPVKPFRPHKSAGSRGTKSSSGIDVGRFAPGTMLGERYRISERLGKGGMGEVYKAEDLKLGQLVALKFLPEHLSFNEESLSRLFNEVKIARQVSHPNVCRVHDIGDVDGHHFLSMEYVDGEDLASLLRRIGRLPADKALQLARQLCAGLAAAHDKGVLHRDLKPANVMIDGRGHVRITDFGLAGLAAELRGSTGRAGTPAYMAPEQLAGKGVTTKSDLFSLGLVLFEVFSGKPVFRPESLAQLTEMHSKPPPPLSSVLPDADARIDRIILRCLEKDPLNRPNSALSISGALPGGNPLADALAAGETPSPELVAASGERGSLKPGIVAAILCAVLAGLVGIGVLNARNALLKWVPMEMSPEVLTNQARQILKKVGLPEGGAGSARGFSADERFLAYAADKKGELATWSRLTTGQPAALRFWHRRSTKALLPVNGAHIVTASDPPVIAAGDRLVVLDMTGHLVELRAPASSDTPVADSVTPAGETKPAAADSASDAAAKPGAETIAKTAGAPWPGLLEAAGFDAAKLVPVPADFVPPTFADSRAAWAGTLPERPEIPVRIEAAAVAGMPTYFKVSGDWERQPAAGGSDGQSAIQVALLSVFLIGLVYIAPTLLAVHNLRRGRGDRKGAMWFALAILVGKLLAFILGADMAAWDPAFFGQAVGSALHYAVLFWIVYMAVEPLIRRFFPQSMISWSRFIAGGFKDPLVGRDILLGCGLGIIWLLLVQAVLVVTSAQAGVPPRPLDLRPVISPLFAAGAMLDAAMLAGIAPVFVALIFVLTRSFLKSTALRTAVECFLLSLFFAVMMSSQVGPRAATLGAAVGLVFGSGCAIIFARFGLLMLLSAFLTASILSRMPVVLGLPGWVSLPGIAAMVVVVAIAGFGAIHAAKGSRKSVDPALGQW